MAFVSLLTSGAVGSLIGLAGSWLTKREERKNIEIQHKFEFQMAKVRQEEASAEYNHELAMADKQVERAKTEGEIAQDLKGLDAFIESQKEVSKSTGIKFVDALRGIMRPVITMYLLTVSSMLAWDIHKMVGGLTSLDINKLFVLYQNILLEVIFLTSTAVTWWFGSRPSQNVKYKK